MRWLMILVALIALRLDAQTPPTLAGDVTWSSGRGRGGEYLDGVRGVNGARLSASARHWATPRSGLVAELSIEALTLSQSYNTSCTLSKRGGCIKPFPVFAGAAVTVGGIWAPSARSELRAGVGGAWYHADTGVTTPLVAHTAALVTHLDAAQFVWTHLALTAGARGVLLPSFRQERLSEVTVTVGARVR